MLSFPQATNQTLLDKFKHQHEDNSYIEFPAVMEPAFIIKHYAGKVKYGVKVSKCLTEYSFWAVVCSHLCHCPCWAILIVGYVVSWSVIFRDILY